MHTVSLVSPSTTGGSDGTGTPEAGARRSLPEGLRLVDLRSAQSLAEASRLYSRVFKYDASSYSLNPHLLSAIARYGGSTVGIRDAHGALIAFAYGFAGTDHSGEIFHYSQAAVVDPGVQGGGLGRALKERQREVALGWDQHIMRWTFDPLLARNAHFNLSSLGAVAVAYERDYYGRPGSDRLVVDWDLDRADEPWSVARRTPPPALDRAAWGTAVQAAPGSVAGAAQARWIALPSGIGSGDAETLDLAQVRTRLADTLARAFAEGFRLVACTRVDDAANDTAAYLAVLPVEGGGDA